MEGHVTQGWSGRLVKTHTGTTQYLLCTGTTFIKTTGGEREGGKEGGREGGRKGGREGGREGEREEGEEGTSE